MTDSAGCSAQPGRVQAWRHVAEHGELPPGSYDRAALVADLVAAGLGNRVLLSGNAIGVAKGFAGYELPYAHVLTAFAPLLASHGVADEDIHRLLVANPRDLLAVR